MEVEVRLFATLRQDRFREKKLDVSEDCTVGEVLRQLGIGSQEVAILLVNGQHVTVDYHLHTDDVVSLFPLIAGG
jgi:sulfur-carrier protein